jgi:hypothetical protein
VLFGKASWRTFYRRSTAFILIQALIKQKPPVSTPFQKPPFEALKSSMPGSGCSKGFVWLHSYKKKTIRSSHTS